MIRVVHLWKVAFFRNDYMDIGIPERRVSFRTLWYEKQQHKKGLKPLFASLRNWPLRGLFWLSKDVHERKEGFREAIRPGARHLADIRNHLEHKHLKVHEALWPSPPPPEDDMERAFADTLAQSTHRSDLDASALTMIKMARAALIYLSRSTLGGKTPPAERSPDHVNLPTRLGRWDDEWKC